MSHSYSWLSQKDLEWCLSAEQDWLRRLPEIIARNRATAKKWRDEEIRKQAWEELRDV